MDKTQKENPAKKQNVHDGHRKRLRELFLNVDILNMPQLQIVELMLTFAQPYKDVNPLAHRLLDEFGNIANIFDASIDDLKKIDGMGETTATYIRFLAELPKVQSFYRNTNSVVIKNSADIVKFLKSKVHVTTKEQAYYVLLSSSGKVLAFKQFGFGSLASTNIDLRAFLPEVFKFATSGVVICHTHPHGEAYPSQEDLFFTKNLENMLNMIGITLCDHVIFSTKEYFSFYQKGLLRVSNNSIEYKDLFRTVAESFREKNIFENEPKNKPSSLD